jgi:hypothetical protein
MVAIITKEQSGALVMEVMNLQVPSTFWEVLE